MGEPTPHKPTPAATGTLAKTPLLHLLVYLLEKKLTGTIELVSPDARSAAIVFALGLPSKVRTSEPLAYLGRVLLDMGHLTEEGLTRSLADLARAKAAAPVLHGQLLLAEGAVDAAMLKAGLSEQLARKLRHVAAMPEETMYAYYDGFDTLRGWGGDGEGVDPVPLFWGMLLEYAPWERVGAALASVSASPLRLAQGAALDRLALSKEERAAAELLRARPMRVSEIPGAGRLNDRTAQLLAYLLLVTKQVDVLSPHESPSAPPLGAPHASHHELGSGPPPSKPSPLTPTAPTVRSSSMLPPTAAHASSRSSWPSASMRKLVASAPSIPPMSPPSSAATWAARSRPSTSPPPPPDGLAPELADRWREVIERAATIDRADYFMMLDLPRDAKHDDIEAAFFGLVKRWHPDRLPPELSPVRAACSRVFARINEAHETLTDDDQRARYMLLLADGSGSPETQATVAKVIEAATNFQKAEVCFKRSDYAQAEAFCRRAMEDDATQPDYVALLAWLIALKPESQTPEKTVASIQMLERAITMNEKCEKAYYWRAMLFKRLGKNELAFRDFRSAVELNPRNIDAAREVRLYHMRGGRRSSVPPKRSTPAPPRPDDPGKTGLLGRLFKK